MKVKRMRDILFKNLTSEDKKRKILSTTETVDKHGVRSVVRRHFICMVKEVLPGQYNPAPATVNIFKEYRNKEQTGRFFCKIKGCVYATSNGKYFLVFYAHSLKISLHSLPAGF